MSAQLTTADEINADHKVRFAALLAEYGGNWHDIPLAENMRLGAVTREHFVRIIEVDTQVDPSRRHDKTDKLGQYVKDHVGETVTMPDLAEAVGCSQGTAYSFLRDNRSLFRSGPERGTYVIIDAEAERDAARAAAKRSPSGPLLASPGSNPTGGTTTAPDDSATAAANVLDAMTGATPTRRTGIAKL